MVCQIKPRLIFSCDKHSIQDMGVHRMDKLLTKVHNHIGQNV